MSVVRGIALQERKKWSIRLDEPSTILPYNLPLQEARMPIRLFCALLLLLVVPATSQRAGIQQRINETVDQHQQKISEVPATAGVDVRAARIHAIYKDANELSVLSASVHSDLRKVQQGLLAKDLPENLKKMEKLSKKLRREME
jgi:hypothetical protein